LCETYVDVDCPDYNYPDAPQVPDFDGSVEKLRAAASRLDEIRADVVATEQARELTVFYAQLLAAVEALAANATHNADVLVQSTGAGEGGSYLNETEIKTLRGDAALPAIRQMNREGVELVTLLGLRIGDYDLPGGRDADPDDHSTATTPAQPTAAS
jgi:hypothetical protein